MNFSKLDEYHLPVGTLTVEKFMHWLNPLLAAAQDHDGVTVALA